MARVAVILQLAGIEGLNGRFELFLHNHLTKS
jgi:hypothetical protein